MTQTHGGSDGGSPPPSTSAAARQAPAATRPPSPADARRALKHVGGWGLFTAILGIFIALVGAKSLSAGTVVFGYLILAAGGLLLNVAIIGAAVMLGIRAARDE